MASHIQACCELLQRRHPRTTMSSDRPSRAPARACSPEQLLERLSPSRLARELLAHRCRSSSASGCIAPHLSRSTTAVSRSQAVASRAWAWSTACVPGLEPARRRSSRMPPSAGRGRRATRRLRGRPCRCRTARSLGVPTRAELPADSWPCSPPLLLSDNDVRERAGRASRQRGSHDCSVSRKKFPCETPYIILCC